MISEIFLKIADNKTLSQTERVELQNFVDRTAKTEAAVSGWISPPYSPESPYIRSLRGTEAFFDFIPTEGIICVKSGGVSIPDDTQTTISFNSGSLSAYFQRTSGTIYIPHTSNLIACIGKAQFEFNTTGRRAVHVNRYTEEGTFQTGDTLVNLSAAVEDPTTVSWAATLYIPEVSGTHSFQMTVVQTSGGALSMEYMSASFFVVR